MTAAQGPARAPGEAIGAPPEVARPPSARRRPVAVTILASIQLLIAALAGLLAVLVLLDPGSSDAINEALGPRLATAAGPDAPTLFAAILGAIAVLEGIAAIALLRMRRIGWTLAMLLSGVTLASQIYTFYANGNLLPLSMLLNVVTVLYLNQHQVRAAFGLAEPRRSDLEDERG